MTPAGIGPGAVALILVRAEEGRHFCMCPSKHDDSVFPPATVSRFPPVSAPTYRQILPAVAWPKQEGCRGRPSGPGTPMPGTPVNHIAI